MLAITVAAPFYGCGGRDDDDVIGNGGKSNSAGYTSGGVSLGGFWSTNGGTAAGSTASPGTGGRSAGGSAGMVGTEPPPPGKGGAHSDGGVEGGEGGAPMKPPGNMNPPQIECPSTAPTDASSCDTAGRCSYAGSRCECTVNAKGGQWKCRASSAACPATSPTAGEECENPEDGALECFYAAGLECRCMKDAWKCMTPTKPGEEPPKPGGPGAGGAPGMPPGPEEGGAPPMMPPPPKPAEAGAGNN